MEQFPAQVVGKEFAKRYYHIQHHSPWLLHLFYQDISVLGRPEDDGSMSITTSIKAINDKILSLNYGDFRTEIKSVDAQDSYDGGVHVLVTGYLTGKEKSVHKFAQSFFLAPQDRGYFVSNDIFQYLDNSSVNPALANDIVAPTTHEPIPAAVQENCVIEGSTPPTEEVVVEEVYNPSENDDVPIVEEEETHVAVVGDQVEDDTLMVVKCSEVSEANGYSIYIKGLPNYASEAMLEEVFKKFGNIKSDGIQVRSNKQKACFGFVEFDEASSVQKALEASPVTIGGCQAFVEEKRSTCSLGNTKGRFYSGSGSGFRNEGVRSRGNYGGGKGYNRGGVFNGRCDYGNKVCKGCKGSSYRDGYQRSENMNSNGGHINRTGVMENDIAENMMPQVPNQLFGFSYSFLPVVHYYYF